MQIKMLTQNTTPRGDARVTSHACFPPPQPRRPVSSIPRRLHEGPAASPVARVPKRALSDLVIFFALAHLLNSHISMKCTAVFSQVASSQRLCERGHCAVLRSCACVSVRGSLLSSPTWAYRLTHREHSCGREAKEQRRRDCSYSDNVKDGVVFCQVHCSAL